MSALASLQDRVARELPLPGPAWSDELLGAVVPGGTLDAAGALDVYRDGYYARLTEQLGETYATVWRMLGDERFFTICRDYVRGHRSQSPNLSDYGRDFPAFLEALGSAPGGAVEDPVLLADLARFELAFHDAFHAPAHEALGGAELASLGDLSGLRFVLGPAVRVIASRHAVYDLFRHRHESEAPDVDVARAQQVLLYKSGDDVLAREIDAASFVALDAMAAGLTIDQALDRACEAEPGFGPADVARLFETIALCGLVASVRR